MGAEPMVRPAEGERRRGVGWIVCVAATRDVVDGVVICPLAGRVAFSTCRDCRFLEATESDWRLVDCTTPDD